MKYLRKSKRELKKTGIVVQQYWDARFQSLDTSAPNPDFFDSCQAVHLAAQNFPPKNRKSVYGSLSAPIPFIPSTKTNRSG